MASTGWLNTGAQLPIGSGTYAMNGRLVVDSITRSDNTITVHNFRGQGQITGVSGGHFYGYQQRLWTELPRGAQIHNGYSFGSGGFSTGQVLTTSSVTFTRSVGANATSISVNIGASMRSENGVSWAGGANLGIPSLGSPSGSNISVSDVTDSTAVAHASLSGWGANATHGSGQRVEYHAEGDDWSYMPYSTSTSHTSDLTDLVSNQTYYARTWASNGGGKGQNSSTVTFVTLPPAPTVDDVTFPGTTADVAYTQPQGGTVYDITTEYSLDGGDWTGTNGTGKISLSGLNADQEYTITLRATSYAGTTTGEPATFTYTPPIITPEAPSFSRNVITIPSQAGVDYLIGDEVVTGNVAITEDTTVTALPWDGYSFAEGATTEWTFELLTEVTPESPTFRNNTITIPTTAGVTYHIGGDTATGSVIIFEDTNVTATANDGYFIPDDAVTTWAFYYVSPAPDLSYIQYGNFVEVHVSLEDASSVQYEPIQGAIDVDDSTVTENIQDENGDPIYGGVSNRIDEGEKDILKFSGYIETVGSDYNANTVSLGIVSHGTALSNSLMTNGDAVTDVVSQTTQNASELVDNRRYRFRVSQNTKINSVTLYIGASAGGAAACQIGLGSDTIATSYTKSWSSGLTAGTSEFDFSNPPILEGGKDYWLRVTNVVANTVSWYYQSGSSTYDQGSRQTYSNGRWSDVSDHSDIYFEITTETPATTYTYSGGVAGLVDAVVESVSPDPLFVGNVADSTYSINRDASVSTGKDMLDFALAQSGTGYWYSVNQGTGVVDLQPFPTDTSHTFVLGRDFTKFNIDRGITNITNDVLFIGGNLTGDTESNKLAIRQTDNDSISSYRRGLSIVTNDKVTRYDTAALLANYQIGSNSRPRYTTSITIPAKLYNIERIGVGQLVRIVNAQSDTLASGLQVASVDYTPGAVTLGLDSSPTTINSTIDSIKRELDNSTQAGV